MSQDLGIMLKQNPNLFRVMRIQQARMGYMGVDLVVRIVEHRSPNLAGYLAEIGCYKAVDYSLRPRNPNCLGGGPFMEFHEQHELLLNPYLQAVPGGDGDVFEPPIKFCLLILDQSYVIAERFEIAEFHHPGKPAGHSGPA